MTLIAWLMAAITVGIVIVDIRLIMLERRTKDE